VGDLRLFSGHPHEGLAAFSFLSSEGVRAASEDAALLFCADREIERR